MCWSDSQFDLTNLTPSVLEKINFACGIPESFPKSCPPIISIFIANYPEIFYLYWLFPHFTKFQIVHKYFFIFITGSLTLPIIVFNPSPSQHRAQPCRKIAGTLTKYSNIQSEKFSLWILIFCWNFPIEKILGWMDGGSDQNVQCFIFLHLPFLPRFQDPL